MQSAYQGSRSDLSTTSSDTLSGLPCDLIARRRIQYGNSSTAALGIFMEYCNNSTIHGIRYLGERRRPFLERIFWICFFVISIILCGHLMINIRNKWNETPVIISFEERAVSLASIPFPSIIICPETKVHAKMFNFSKVYSELKEDKKRIKNLNQSELVYLEAFLHLCDPEIASALNVISKLITSNEIKATLEEMALDMNSSMPWCKFRRHINWSDDILMPIFTDDGLCYQFNGLQSEYLLRDHLKAFWVSFFVLSIYVCGHLTMNIWNKWNDTPVIVSFAERSLPLADIPFPSIILCPETKAHAKVFNFSRIYFELKADREALRNLNKSELEYLEAFLHVCDADIVSNLNITALNTSKHILETIEELGPDMNSSSPWCKFNRIINWCEDILTPIFTDDGLCYQFNGLQTEYLLRNTSVESDNEVNPDWTLESGYTDPLKTDVHPQRVFAAGESGSFFLVTKGFQYDLEYLCRGSVPGFRVYLQSPDDVPQAPKPFIKVPFMEAIQITLKPNYITTSETLRKYEPERRQCYFSDERHLRFFKIYNQNNCNFECLINYTIKECGCVKYTMPKPDDVRVCGLSDISCYTNAENGILLKEFNEGIRFSKTNKYWKSGCHCLPSCTSLDYDFEISRAHYDIKNLLIAYRDDYLDENPELLMSRIKISFKERLFTAVKRSELYGTTNFLANCGGLFGLFMGVSTLSLVELIYFCTVRLASNMKMRRRKQNSAFAAKIFGEGLIPGTTLTIE